MAVTQEKRPAVALIGCGRWGRNYLQHLGDYWHDVHVCDHNRDRMADVARTYPDYNFPSWEEELDMVPELDTIICVPPQHTHERVKRWIGRASRILVEKPYFPRRNSLFDDYPERDGCYIGHIRLQTPLMRFLREYHSRDEQNEVTFIRKLAERRFGSIGLMPDLFIHDIAVVFRMLGSGIDDLAFEHYEETQHFLETVLRESDGSRYTFRYVTDSDERADQVELKRGQLSVLLDERKTSIIQKGEDPRDLSDDVSPLERQVQKLCLPSLSDIDLFSFEEMIRLEKFFEKTFGDRAFTGL